MRRSELIHIISESIKRQLLNEGDSRLNKVMRIISDEFSGLLDLNGVVRSSEYYVNNNPNTTWGQYLLYSLRHNFGLMTNNDVKYLPFVAKIAFSNEVGFEKRNNNSEQINTLRDIVQALKKDPELYNNLLNKGVDTYSELVEIMTPYLQKKEQEELNNINNKEYTHNTDYDIIEIHSYEEAHEIGEYSSLQSGGSKLCYTQSEETWEEYTDYGNNRVFCLLKHGWKEMKPIAGENAPYDEYGLSMIFIFFNKKGKITTCNTRWNHEHSEWLHSGMSVDNSLSAEELSEIIGGNIYEVLGINRLDATFDNAQSLLDKGYKPEEIFDYVGKFIDGYAYVKLNVKWNWISTDNRLVSPEQWFDDVRNFSNGYAAANVGNNTYIIDTNGRFVKEVAFDNIQELLDKGYNPYNIFDTVFSFHNGYAKVKLNGKYNFVSEDYRLVSPNQWFDNCSVFKKDGYAWVNIGNNKYIIDTNGKIVEEVTFDNVQELLDKGLRPDVIFDYIDYSFINGYACVALNNKFNWISADNHLVSPNQWFDSCDYFINGYARIKLNNKMNWISLDNRLVSPEQWFDGVLEFNENGYASAKIGNTWYKIDTNGQLYDSNTMQPINSQNSTNIALNELKHIIRESIKRQLNKQ